MSFATFTLVAHVETSHPPSWKLPSLCGCGWLIPGAKQGARCSAGRALSPVVAISCHHQSFQLSQHYSQLGGCTAECWAVRSLTPCWPGAGGRWREIRYLRSHVVVSPLFIFILGNWRHAKLLVLSTWAVWTFLWQRDGEMAELMPKKHWSHSLSSDLEKIVLPWVAQIPCIEIPSPVQRQRRSSGIFLDEIDWALLPRFSQLATLSSTAVIHFFGRCGGQYWQHRCRMVWCPAFHSCFAD